MTPHDFRILELEIFLVITCRYFINGKFFAALKGRSQQWDRADPDTTFAWLKSVYLNPKSNVPVGCTSRNPLQSYLVFHWILKLLQETSF